MTPQAKIQEPLRQNEKNRKKHLIRQRLNQHWCVLE